MDPIRPDILEIIHYTLILRAVIRPIIVEKGKFSCNYLPEWQLRALTLAGNKFRRGT